MALDTYITNSRKKDLLHEIAKILRIMARVLKHKETERLIRKFYTELMFHCSQVESCLKYVPQIADSLLYQLSDRFKSLIAAPNKDDVLISPKPTSYAILQRLLDTWNEIVDQSDNAKLSFSHRYLNFGSSSNQRDDLTEFLDNWVDEFSAQYPEYALQGSTDDCISQKKRRSEPPYAVWDHVQGLFNALLASKNCTCKPTHEYDVRLSLKTYRKHDTDKTPSTDEEFGFDMFLATQQFRQEVYVHTIQEPTSVVRFAPNEVSIIGQTLSTEKRKQVRKLCESLEKVKNMRPMLLRFKVEKGLLWKLRSETSRSRIDKSQEPKSLEYFIKERSGALTEKIKRILAVLLSYAIFHLYGTPWLQPAWGSSKVLFFQTNSCTIPLRPFIYAQLFQARDAEYVTEVNCDLDEMNPDDTDPDDDLFNHPCPCLVTLATMLMELYMAMPFQKLAEKYEVELSSSIDNSAKFIDAISVFERCKPDIPENSQFVVAIDKCLKPNLWQDKYSQTLDEQSIRRILYQEVIEPLEDELKQAFSYISIEKLDSEAQNLDFANWGQIIQNDQSNAHSSLHLQMSSKHPLDGSILPQFTTESQQHVPNIYYGVKQSNFKFFDDETSPEGFSIKARDQYVGWKEDFLTVYNEFITNRVQDSLLTPVKMALLDTGLDLTHPDMRGCESRIKGKYNWVNNQDKQKVPDSSGHGTHTAGLLLDYAPHAELYVAKIADKDPSDPRIIATAINYAVTEWNVDIIAMSFGFTERVDGYQELEEAIQNAHHSRVLLFAAASNSGANLDRAYPARHEEVICVHSTDANGNSSAFNPNPIVGDNWATIGEAVESAWPTNLRHVKSANSYTALKSGTSFATPIAASIAGFLLQYARLYLPEKWADMLRQSSSMKAVLRRISKRRGEYDYIFLSRYTDNNLFGKHEEHIRSEIVDTINRS